MTATNLERAVATRDAINAKLEAAKHDLKVLNDRRDGLAFDAHSVGGPALAELDKITKSLIVAVAGIDSLNVAVIEASRRIDDAHRAEAAAADSADAAKAMVIADGLGRRAERLDKALAVLVQEANEFENDLRTLNHTLHCSHPNEFQFRSNGERAVKACLMFSPFKWETMAPRERHTFAELATGWIAMIERWCDGRLPVKEDAA